MVYISIAFLGIPMNPLFYISFFYACAPVFTAEINGYILDSETYEGIPSVELKFYNSTPRDFDDTRYIYQTSTGNDGTVGYFSQSLIWNAYLAKYGKKGDVIDMHWTIVHPDYQPQIAEITGIVSGTSNTIPTVLLQSLEASVPNVQGSIYTDFGPENDVQVALYLGDDDLAYARTFTQNINGLDGKYLFSDISWRDAELTGSNMATVLVEDPRYTNPNPASVSQEIYHQTSTQIMDDIVVEIIRPKIFQATITGHASFLIETTTVAEYRPIAGAEIEFEWYYNDDTQTNIVNSFVRTNENGDFSITIDWEDDTPDNDSSIPDGADQIDVSVSYPSGGVSGFEYDLRAYNDTFTIRSWIENTIPSAYEYIPLPPEE